VDRNNSRSKKEDLPCQEIHGDDGIDPRRYFQKPQRKRRDYKAEQLCGQGV